MWTCAACHTDDCWGRTNVCYWCKKPRQAPKSDGQGDGPKDTHQDADGDASNETTSGIAKKLEIFRARLKDLEQLSQEPGMGFASEATTKLQEQIDGLLAQKEATLPACYADAAVRRRLRGAEKAQTKADAQVAKLKQKLEDIQTQLRAAQNKAEQAGKKVESLRVKEKSLARPPTPKGWDSVCAHLELAKTSLGADGEEQDAEVTKQLEVALALAAKRKANAAEKMAVVMDEDGASLSGDCPRYKRRARAGPEEQGEDVLQLKAKASPRRSRQPVSRPVPGMMNDIPDQCATTRSDKQVFITCNANTANQFEKVLHRPRYQAEAPVVFDQELQLAPKQVKLLSARLIEYGWKAAVVPSAPTKEGMPQTLQLTQKYIDHEALNAFLHDRMYAYEMHWNRYQCFDGDELLAHSGHGDQAVYKIRELAPPPVRDKGAPTARVMATEWVASLLRDLVHILSSGSREAGGKDAVHIKSIKEAMTQKGALVQRHQHGEELMTLWSHVFETILECMKEPQELPECLEYLQYWQQKSAGALRKWTKSKVPWEPLVPQHAREAKSRLGEPPETAPAGETYQHVAMMRKRVALNGCYTEGKFWARGIVAGSVFGPLCLPLGLIGAIDDLYVASPRADMCLYFDDLAASTRGDVAAVAALHMKLTDEIALAFEQVLKLQLSRGRDGKTVVAVSHGSVERQLGSHNKQMGIQVVREAVHLGVTQPAERRRRVGAQSKRIMKAKARSWKTQRVKAAGGAAEKVVKLGSAPPKLYGTRVQGATDTLITTRGQTVAAAVPGCNKGRSAALVLLAEDADPAVIANAGPIVEWARAWQEATDMATRGLLVTSWRSW
ncbi:unnamed protein product [Prorocentrum cordatum]|uniref:Reverse transcriptase domain-containing protein n=1 Tax=Prorocentrum cordatum TaxID=2364126 RepID=A0ABN9XGI3_9DINO|nr:unnamed protein product [Polarella glacialis]